MPSSISGIPLHPLVVHAVVVLLPLAALGVAAVALVPAWRRSYATLVLVVTAVATLTVPLATTSGEDLEERVPETGLVERHAELGDTVLWFAVPLLLVAVALWWVARQERMGRPVARWAAVAVSVVGVIAALAVTVQVVLVGHSGAKAAWSDSGSSSGEDSD